MGLVWSGGGGNSGPEGTGVGVSQTIEETGRRGEGRASEPEQAL